MSMELSFHGAADTVTGSCHLLNVGNLNILIDCGLFQGGKKLEDKNYGDFGFDPASIDYLLLTHGHLDHCGRIPALVKKGFNGRIITTSATYDIAKIVFMDSAKLQEEDYEHWKRISLRKGLKPQEPLYTTMDALDALKFFGDYAEYGQPVTLNDRVTVTFRDAGHILGAAFVELEIRGEGKVIFSGDLGNRKKPVIRDPAFPSSADVVVIESTYAMRMHKEVRASVEELLEAILDTFRKGGNVLIPSFAVERAQDLLFILRELHDEGKLPPCKVFLDSPMGIRVTEVMRKHPECFDRETKELLQKREDPFEVPGLTLTRTAEESREVNRIKSHAIIIAGSGMCTGGRIKHHLKHNIWRPESSIIFSGYQAEGTLGRNIVERRKRVRIFGETYRVNAGIYTIGGFSAHADREILLDWLRHTDEPEHLFLVHGEKENLQAFREDLAEKRLAKDIHVPHMHERFVLS
jgi:metallo-beta-lactamase family protein